MAAKIAFRLVHEPAFKADVLLPIPGESEQTSLSLTFKYKTPEQLDDYLSRASEVLPEDSKPEENYKVLVDSFMEMVSGWGIDEDFSPANIKQALISYPTLASAAMTVYTANLMGQQQVKNL